MLVCASAISPTTSSRLAVYGAKHVSVSAMVSVLGAPVATDTNAKPWLLSPLGASSG